MDVTFVLSAIIFTLLAIVVATSLLNGSSPATDFAKARSYFGHHGDAGGLAQNGHVPDKKKKQQQQQQQQGADDWSDISGSSHDHWDVVNNSLKYVPGKARSHHLETMMSKDELEEEQRVQHEQLAAIFQLLKDNKETFGDVSEGDMEEQLRLYSI
uniref:Matrix-remodeling-associated protein 7 helical domain-containing protein n=1 Tax=Amphiprion ocellaris TaxID=80972 RepID=A0A3Q1BVD0_AMPOC